MNPNSLVSIDDLSEEQILQLLETARYFEEHPNHKILDGKVVATLFFEPSTRTRLSFETAVNRLGGRVIGFSDASTTSSSKGETLKDTIKMVSNYVDLIIMRHYLEGAARYATEVTDIPIINAGPLFNPQNPGYAVKPDNNHGGRPEIRSDRSFAPYGNEILQPHLPVCGM